MLTFKAPPHFTVIDGDGYQRGHFNSEDEAKEYLLRMRVPFYVCPPPHRIKRMEGDEL